VFGGSTNQEEIFRDTTGNRRYWPVTPGKIDIETLRKDRDQLWAEAVHRYRAGEKWWIDEPGLAATAAMVQAAHQEGDPWDGPIAQYLDGLSVEMQQLGVTTEDVLEQALHISDMVLWDHAKKCASANVSVVAGGSRSKVGVGGTAIAARADIGQRRGPRSR
jgi:predicted P-loop ATPase